MINFWVSDASIKEIQDLKEELLSAKKRLNNRSKPHTQAMEYMADRWSQNYAGEGSIYGQWAALADWTVKDRGSAHPILQRTGSMLGYVQQMNMEADIDTESTQWEFQNQAGGPWPVSHHTGYPNPIKRANPIPARVIWAMNEDDTEYIGELFEIWLDEVFIGVG